MGFDLLTEPWLPVTRCDGETEMVGLRELLVRAHEFKDISEISVTREFGCYRFLFTFLMDMYKPTDRYDLEELLEQNRFSADVIDGYIDECRREGVSFDLFDQKRPFMQVPANESEENENTAVFVAKLDPAKPSGNNHVHFEHQLEEEADMSYAEAARNLLAVTAFSTAGVQGYPSTVNGAPPVYVVVRGKNLFATLVLGMMTRADFDRYDDPPPLWRWQGTITPKKEVASTSLLMGLTFPCRRVRLKDAGNGRVRTMSYSQGMKFIGYESFQDPYVPYRIDEKDQTLKNMKPQMDRELWRDLSALVNCQNGKPGAPQVVKQAVKLLDDEAITISAYAVATNKGAYYDAKREEYVFAKVLLGSQSRWEVMKNCQQYAERKGQQLRKAFTDLQHELGSDPKNSGGSIEGIKKRKTKAFFEQCYYNFMKELKPALEQKSSPLTELESSWKEKTLRAAVDAYDSVIKEENFPARTLVAIQKCRQSLFDKISKKEDKA